jgi:large subunit ribosomal protein L13
MSTRIVTQAQSEKSWYVVDVDGQVLGRTASEVARILRGKHKPIYAPSVDAGDFVVIINAEKVRLTGNKLADKMYHRHSGYPGGLKSINAEKLLASKPEELIKKAIKGMLPKNKLGRQMFKKLKVYAGSDHPHQAQQPKELKF